MPQQKNNQVDKIHIYRTKRVSVMSLHLSAQYKNNKVNKIHTEPKAQWNPTNYISKHTTALHSMSFSSYPTHAHSNDTQRQGILSPEQKSWVFRADLMMLWKNCVRERVWQIVPEYWCLIKGALTRRLEVSRWKTKESSISRWAELVRWNVELDEIREMGRGLAVQWFKGKKKNVVLNTGFDRKPA